MPVDELPMYPTPQQAAYTVGNQSQGSSRKQSHPKQSNVVYRPAQHSKPVPSQYSHLQPHNTQAYQAQPPADYQGQYQTPSQPPPPPQAQQYPQYQPQPAQQQYYQPQPVPVPVQPSYGTYGANEYANSPVNSHHPQPQSQSQPQPQRQPPQQAYQVPPQQHQPYQPSQPPQHPQQRYQNFNNAPPVVSNSHQNPHKKPPPSNATPAGSKESLSMPNSTPPKQHVSSKQKLENELKSVFNKVDTNHSGKISSKELSLALLNFDHTRFQDSTISLMIKLFSGSNGSSSGSSKSLTFEQFVSLWKYLSAYKKLFIAADSNKSGDISFGEFQKVLEQIGYKLNIDLVLHLFQKFAQKARDDGYDDGSVGKLKFDAFIELLVYLRKLTDIFKKYDKDLSGVATINFSDFLFEVSNLS